MSIINVPYKENIFLGEGLKFDEGGPEKQVIYLLWPYAIMPSWVRLVCSPLSLNHAGSIKECSLKL